MKSDCLYELDESSEDHAKWLHEWLLKHPQANSRLGRSIIVAAVVVGVAIVIGAIIIRPNSARFKSVGTNRIFDVQTGEVRWADPPEENR